MPKFMVKIYKYQILGFPLKTPNFYKFSFLNPYKIQVCNFQWVGITYLDIDDENLPLKPLQNRTYQERNEWNGRNPRIKIMCPGPILHHVRDLCLTFAKAKCSCPNISSLRSRPPQAPLRVREGQIQHPQNFFFASAGLPSRSRRRKPHTRI